MRPNSLEGSAVPTWVNRHPPTAHHTPKLERADNTAGHPGQRRASGLGENLNECPETSAKTLAEQRRASGLGENLNTTIMAANHNAYKVQRRASGLGENLNIGYVNGAYKSSGGSAEPPGSARISTMPGVCHPWV